MNEAQERLVGHRLAGALGDIFGPVHAPHGTWKRKLLTLRSMVAYGGLLTTLVQVVVWLTIAVFTGHLDSPWWLWTTVPAAAAVVALTALDRWRTGWASVSTTHPTRRRRTS